MDGSENKAAQSQGASQQAPATAMTMPVAQGVHWSGSPEDIPASAPHYGRKEDGSGTQVMIACAMLEDEVMAAYNQFGRGMRVVWVDRGYHENPDVLRARLQEMIDAVEAEDHPSEILMAIGLCGNGVVGLKAQHATLAIPRFDDCINLMLCKGPRTCRGLAQAGIMYLTRGWAHDATMVTGQREYYARKYGERRADRLMKAMFGAYRGVSLIDNGCYNPDEVQEYAQKCAEALDVPIQVDPGSNEIMEKLVSGNWDSDILVCEPGRAIAQSDFDYAPDGVACACAGGCETN